MDVPSLRHPEKKFSAIVVRILVHLDSAPKCTCTAVLCLWQKNTFGNQLAFLEWQVEEGPWRERPLQKVRKIKSLLEEYTSQISFSSRLLYGNPSLIEKATELPGVSSRLQGFFCPKDAAPGRPKEKVASAFVSSSSNTLNYWFRKQFGLDKPPCSWSESAESPTVPEPSNPAVANTMVSLKDSTDLPGFLPSVIGQVYDSFAKPVEPPASEHSCFPKPFSSLCCMYFTLLWDLH